MNEVSVSKNIMCDLLDCKSKVEDMKMLVDEWSVQLKDLGLLNRMTDILYANRYMNDLVEIADESTDGYIFSGFIWGGKKYEIESSAGDNKEFRSENRKNEE